MRFGPSLKTCIQLITYLRFNNVCYKVRARVYNVGSITNLNNVLKALFIDPHKYALGGIQTWDPWCASI